VPNPIDPTDSLTIYNLDPALRTAVNLVDYNSTNNKRWYNAFDIGFQSRVLGGTVFGGASWGQQVFVNCDVQDPNNLSSGTAVATPSGIAQFPNTGLRYCDQSKFGMPYRGQYKISGTYPLPLQIQVSGSFQSNPGGNSSQNGTDQSQTELYNINAATFRALTGATLTPSQIVVALIQ